MSNETALDFVDMLKSTGLARVFEAYHLTRFSAWRDVDGHEQKVLITVRDAGEGQPNSRFAVTVRDDATGTETTGNSDPTLHGALMAVHWDVVDGWVAR